MIPNIHPLRLLSNKKSNALTQCDQQKFPHLQSTFPNSFSHMTIIVFWLRFGQMQPCIHILHNIIVRDNIPVNSFHNFLSMSIYLKVCVNTSCVNMVRASCYCIRFDLINRIIIQAKIHFIYEPRILSENNPWFQIHTQRHPNKNVMCKWHVILCSCCSSLYEITVNAVIICTNDRTKRSETVYICVCVCAYRKYKDYVYANR